MAHLDTFQVAEMMGLAPATVRRLAHQGLLRNVGYARRDGAKHGRPRALYDVDEVLRLMDFRRRPNREQRDSDTPNVTALASIG